MSSTVPSEVDSNNYSMQQFLEDLMIEAVSNVDTSNVLIPGKMLTPEEAKEEYKNSLGAPLDTQNITQRYKKGLEFIKQHLGEYPNDRLCLKELEQADKIRKGAKNSKVIPSKNIDPRLYPQTMAMQSVKSTENDASLPFALQWGLSPETVSTFYNIGVKLFEEEKYEEALSVFTFLSVINNYSHEVWVSLGMCHERLKEWLAAVRAFLMANYMDPHDPLPYFHSIDCYLALHNKSYAQLSLEMAKYFMSSEQRNQLGFLINKYESLISY